MPSNLERKGTKKGEEKERKTVLQTDQKENFESEGGKKRRRGGEGENHEVIRSVCGS